MKDDKFKRVRCLDTATNSIKYIPKHLTENAVFMQNRNLVVQDLEVKKEEFKSEVIDSVEEEIQAPELNFNEAPKTEKRKRKAKQE